MLSLIFNNLDAIVIDIKNHKSTEFNYLKKPCLYLHPEFPAKNIHRETIKHPDRNRETPRLVEGRRHLTVPF